LLVITAKAHGEQIFLGDLAFGIQQFRMNRDAAGAVTGRRAWAGCRCLIAACAAGVAWPGHGLKTLGHHLEGLPEQNQKAGAVENGKDLGKKGVHGPRPAADGKASPPLHHCLALLDCVPELASIQAQSVVQAAPKVRKANNNLSVSMAR